VGRILIKKLPANPWRRKIAEEAEKRSQHGLLVLEGLPSDVSEAEVEQLINIESGQQPLRVERDGKKVRVQTASEQHMRPSRCCSIANSYKVAPPSPSHPKQWS
jgi:hypothetical protein